MKNKFRREGFLLPLAILCILIVAVISMNGFFYIQQHTDRLTQSQNKIKVQEQKKKFSKLAFQNDNLEKLKYSFNYLNLSGLYNLSSVTRTDLDNKTHIIREQFEILKRLTDSCAGQPGLATKITNYLLNYTDIQKGFGLIDLLNEISIPLNVGIKLLPCMRILPRSYKINLSLASEEILMAYFNINYSNARQLSKYITDGITPNKESINSYLKLINPEKNFTSLLRNTVISSQLDHRGTVLEYDGETFAYLDTVLDKQGIWVKNRNFFLWVPLN